MHPNPAFRKATRTSTLEFTSQRGFGVLSINGEDGPIAAHVPFTISTDGSYVEAHVMRSNPIARALKAPQSALLAVSGPDGYISPDWYGVEDQVPTWNYIAVHLRGQLNLLPQADMLGVLERLSDEFEARLAPKPIWKTDNVSPEALEKMMRMIVPIRLDITSTDSTRKLGQNKPATARTGAAIGLETSNVGSELSTLAQ
ncbi:MAG: FMN-binding negative transcriptional regulator, partial [Rhodobacteraceae bacterium]|nr:FMN-binding negative transcriptional regulator [Paracoccaceae bacterium]